MLTKLRQVYRPGSVLAGVALVASAAMAGPRPAAPSIDPLSWSINGKPVAGTPAREEMEFKLAFPVASQQTTAQITRAVQAAVRELADGHKLQFGKIAQRNYHLDPEYQAFAFRDLYFDTRAMHVLRAKSAYRLRHRWSRLELYLRHRWLPQFGAYDPTRCEIQFKSDYQLDHDRGIVAL